MATVIVYDRDKVLELTGAAVTGASINNSGQLSLERQALDPINLSINVPKITVDSLMSTTPFYIAHRGSGDEAPEHTLEAYRYAVAAGAKALEISVQLTADGVLVCFHDTDISRMTGLTGAIADYTYAQLKNAVFVKGQALLGQGWKDVEIPLFGKVIEEFYNNVVLFVEPKTTDAAAPLQALLLSLQNAPLSVVYKSHFQATSGLAWAKANGFRTWAYIDPTSTSAQMDAADVSVDYWGVPHTSTDAQITMAVNHLPIKPVIVWEVHRRSQRDHYNVLGVKGMMTSGFRYVTRTTAMMKKSNFGLQIAAPGNITVGNNSATEALKFGAASDVYWTQQPNRSVVMGAMCPIPATTYTIKFDMMFPVIPAASLHAGIAFGKLSDDVYTFGSANASGGYHVLIRDDGDLQLYTHAAGVGSGTQIGASNNGAPDPANPVAGVWMSYNVVVTPTNITVNRTDVAKSFVVADTTYRGGYFHLLAGNTTNTAAIAHFRNVEVVY
jgi:glycerophosphoryl diester phosphodiesterase